MRANFRIFQSAMLRRWRPAALALAALLVLAPSLQAQETGVPIQQQMSPEQFKAAGLDRLDPEQLANLNAWLNRTLDEQNTRAVEIAKKQVNEENRGFLIFPGREPIKSRYIGEFRGFGKGRTYTLENGQVWQQKDDASLAGVRLDSPEVTITPGMIGNLWFFGVEGYNTKAKVQRIK
ncbi:MAG: hypothetical protein M3Q42_07640 [Pseudomonadota bacterium]|nr:hypothetical protein [Pseudomonadota bacterium]